MLCLIFPLQNLFPLAHKHHLHNQPHWLPFEITLSFVACSTYFHTLALCCSQRTHAPTMALRNYFCNQVTPPEQFSPSSSNPQKVPSILFAIFSLTIVTHDHIAPSLLLPVGILGLPPMSKQLLIPSCKQRCNLNWPKPSTFGLTSLPPCKKLNGCRCVYKIKRHSDGIIEHYKARWVQKVINNCKVSIIMTLFLLLVI